MTAFHLAIDWGMDGYSVANGQHRYAVDLLRSLAAIRAADRVTVFGTRPEPPAHVASLFAAGTGWHWRHKPLATRRGADWVNQWRGFRAHRRDRPDVLHTIDAPVPFFPPCPVVATVYDLMAELFPADYPFTAGRGYRRWRWLHRRRVTRYLAISHTTAADLVRLWNVPADRIDVVHLGVSGFPPADFEGTWEKTLAARLPELAGVRFVLSPYNLEPRKNLAALLTAFRAVRDRFPDVKLVLFGKAAWSAEREAMYDARVAQLSLPPAIVRTGFVTDVELAALYRAAEVFAFPALYEGFGLPLVEAMACGGCVLGRNASAMAEVVGDAGLLVETQDPAALAAGLTRLLGDDAERARLRAAGRLRAAAFTPERMARETASVYRRVTGGSPECARR